ncbi:MAG: alpha-glucosidase [Spirochaetales bacterium]|jgi:alpha-galactosidase|nr:alpha-glucosidase [Spirochaetales bacterium]
MKQRIVLVGAGSAQFGYGMLGDIMQSRQLAGSTIVLHDINPETMGVVATTAEELISSRDLPFTIEATTDRKEALEGADFVIISIEVGDRFALWEMDRTIPQQYGITQIYGENGGPGGVFHSLRIIPPILAICDDVEALCPKATVFCYSNPMTAICTTVNRRYPDMRFYGMCHEIASLKRYLPDILGTEFDNLDLTAGGLNHFSVLLEARYRDSHKDAYPDIIERAPAFFEQEPGYSDIWRELKDNPDLAFTEGSEQRAALSSPKCAKSWADRGVFKLILEKFELLPVTVDSHFGEYIGWAHDAADHRGILDFLSWYKQYLGHVQPKIELSLNERVVPIIEGIITDSGYTEAAVNLPNSGLFKELPDFVAVEIPCRIDKQGIHGQTMPALPPGFAALLRNYTGVYDLTAEAILNKSKKLAIQAMLVNPVVNAVKEIDEMVELMIDSQREWLGYLK